MAATLSHRGPDASGGSSMPRPGSASATRVSRSSICRRPAPSRWSPPRRYVVTYNGEIYNFPELRSELEAPAVASGATPTPRSSSRRSSWGVEATLEAADGMFAFAVWDRQRPHARAWPRPDRQEAALLRVARALAFASELKAFAAHPGWRGEIDRDALAAYLRLTYVPSPHSIYRGIASRARAHRHHRCRRHHRDARLLESRRCRAHGHAAPLELGDRGDRRARDAAADAVGRRMVADVPLGAFLSGGIDSSTVVALMRAQSTGRCGPSRSASARRLRRGAHAGRSRATSAPTIPSFTSRRARREAVIPELPTIYDEPFADSSQVPTYLVSKLTRQHVTVALSGDGGDELFAGYTRHRFARSLAGVPASVGKGIACGLGFAGPALWDGCLVCFRRGAARRSPATRCTRPPRC